MSTVADNIGVLLFPSSWVQYQGRENVVLDPRTVNIPKPYFSRAVTLLAATVIMHRQFEQSGEGGGFYLEYEYEYLP